MGFGAVDSEDHWRLIQEVAEGVRCFFFHLKLEEVVEDSGVCLVCAAVFVTSPPRQSEMRQLLPHLQN